MVKVFFSSAIDGIASDIVETRYRRVESDFRRRRYVLMNPASVYQPNEDADKEGDMRIAAQIIVGRDLELLRLADVLLADVSEPSRQYVGCICEMVYARTFGIPVVAFLGSACHFFDRPFFVYHCTEITDNWESALDAVCHVAPPRRCSDGVIAFPPKNTTTL